MATNRENKFARIRANNKNLARESVATVDEQLNRLEDDLRRLKVEFDIYLAGGAKRPPYDTKNRVESQIKRLADDRSLVFSQRYRYNSLVSRHTALRDVWRRTMQDRELGRGPAAAAQAARAAMKQKPAEEAASAAAGSVSFVCEDGHKDVTVVKQLYNALLEAKQRNGEIDETLSFPRFHRLIATKTDVLKESSRCGRVEFSVEMDGGRVSLKAKAGESVN